MLQADPEAHHEDDEDPSPDGKESQDALLLLRKVHDPVGVFLHDPVKHPHESGQHQDGADGKPDDALPLGGSCQYSFKFVKSVFSFRYY